MFLCRLFGGFKGQVKWPEWPPHLVLNPSYFGGLFCFVLFSYCAFCVKTTSLFCPGKKLFLLIFSVSLCFSLACLTSPFHSLSLSLSCSFFAFFLPCFIFFTPCFCFSLLACFFAFVSCKEWHKNITFKRLFSSILSVVLVSCFVVFQIPFLMSVFHMLRLWAPPHLTLPFFLFYVGFVFVVFVLFLFGLLLECLWCFDVCCSGSCFLFLFCLLVVSRCCSVCVFCLLSCFVLNHTLECYFALHLLLLLLLFFWFGILLFFDFGYLSKTSLAKLENPTTPKWKMQRKTDILTRAISTRVLSNICPFLCVFKFCNFCWRHNKNSGFYKQTKTKQTKNKFYVLKTGPSIS